MLYDETPPQWAGWRTYVAEMYKQGERESYSHRNHTKATTVEGINPVTTKKTNKKQKLSSEY